MPTVNKNNTALTFTRVTVLIISVATFWVLTEWLFFVTKPSFMTLYSLWEKMALLAATAFIFSALLLLVSAPLIALGWLIQRFTKFRFTAFVVSFLPVIILLAMTVLLLFDNFTLTLFDWGIRDAHEPGAWAYRLLIVVLVCKATGWLYRLLTKPTYGTDMVFMAKTALAVSVSGIPVVLLAVSLSPDVEDQVLKTSVDLPNILILSSDGLWAEHMSVYGYERPTTPFLDSVKDEFLIAENHFANASDTGGSVVSLLTGKLPTTTRVIYPPDVLRGNDSYQHFPGILKKLGYYNADISMRHYADPYDLNMRDGFSETNFRNIEASGGNLIEWLQKRPGLNPTALFSNQISERMSERFNLIVKDKPIQDPLAEVNKPDKRFIRDPMRMAEIERFLAESHQPFFLHILMMGTHGTRFKPRERIYSTEESYPLDWVIDGYDDSIIDFDRYIKETYELLKAGDLLESTIFVVSSDHGYQHDPLQRVPMLLRMPAKTHTGKIGGNSQRLDIAPTLLELIGSEAPDWMEGQSMLGANAGEFDQRPLFATGATSSKSADGIFWSVTSQEAPWFSLGKLFLVNCKQGFKLNIEDMDLQEKEIAGSNLNCPDKLSIRDARQLMRAHLQERGYQQDQSAQSD